MNPDEYLRLQAHAQDRATGRSSRRRVGTKEFKLVYDVGGGRMTKNVPVPPEDRGAVRHHRRRDPDAGPLGLPDRGPLQRQARPADADGHRMGQGRPHRRAVHRAGAARDRPVAEAAATRSRSTASKRGAGAGHAAGASARRSAGGPVRVIKDVARPASSSSDGEVLVTDKTDPDWEPMMKKAAAIVTNRGGRTCHAAIVSRELGLPAVVGTERGTELLRDGQDGHRLLRRGRHGLRLRGPARRSTSSASDLARPAAAADEGHDERRQPRGGLPRSRSSPTTASAWPARSSSSRTYIKVHPMALVDYDQPRRTRRSEAEIDRADGRLRRQAAVLRRQAGAGRRA